MLQNLEFTNVKELSIQVITDFEININDNNKKYVTTLGFRIDIE